VSQNRLARPARHVVVRREERARGWRHAEHRQKVRRHAHAAEPLGLAAIARQTAVRAERDRDVLES
jgi:hypothetical protein